MPTTGLSVAMIHHFLSLNQIEAKKGILNLNIQKVRSKTTEKFGVKMPKSSEFVI